MTNAAIKITAIMTLVGVIACSSAPSTRKINERLDFCERQYLSTSWVERQKAVLEVSAYNHERAYDFLVKALNDQNPAVRIDAMRGIQNHFHEKISPDIYVSAVKNDSSNKVRLEALDILIAYKNPDHFPVFVNAFGNADWLFRESAIRGITAIDDDEIEQKSIPYIVKAIRDPSPNVRISALTTVTIKSPLIYEEIRLLFYEKDYDKKVTILSASLTALKGYDLDIRLRERVKGLIIHDNEEIRILALRVLKSEPAYLKK